VRITSMLSRFAVMSALGVSALGLGLAAILAAPAMAQDDAQAPAAGQQGQFGPRAGKPGQPGAGQAPKVEIISTHGSWKIQCESTAQEQADSKRSCGMVQVTASEKNPKAFLNVIIVRTKQQDQQRTEVRMLAPLGVFLPMGVALEIDGEAIGRVGYVRCMAQICMATGEIKPETLTKLKKGKLANFIIYEAPGMGLPMKLSLDGFSAALADLDKAI
jgi:invasion protein IalB